MSPVKDTVGSAGVDVTTGGVIVIPGRGVITALEDEVDPVADARLELLMLEEELSPLEVEAVSLPEDELEPDPDVPRLDDDPEAEDPLLEPAAWVDDEDNCTMLIVVRMTVMNVVELRSMVLVNEVVISDPAVVFEVKAVENEPTLDKFPFVAGSCADSVLPGALLSPENDGTTLDVLLAGKGGIMLNVPFAENAGTMLNVLFEGKAEVMLDGLMLLIDCMMEAPEVDELVSADGAIPALVEPGYDEPEEDEPGEEEPEARLEETKVGGGCEADVLGLGWLTDTSPGTTDVEDTSTEMTDVENDSVEVTDADDVSAIVTDVELIPP
ncbi:hypothetical protein AYL99_06936 [Fonsecaea erecta]|uniref:Uncharacterized protein n=1 Tax=Fonsecaea erecta TaxID=1367422 RepID=A0A178ZIM3_9EURO|nr:hypothetical protein AYL99_06936 [Fonsecaea erecta]OAP59638.1 hypothetical protein AYL99_06936 [Fonsecaea erecta]